MPRIEQQYLDCAIYLYDSVASAKAGEHFIPLTSTQLLIITLRGAASLSFD